MDIGAAVATRTGHWSVRTRILVTILVVAAIGLIAAGGTAYLVGRQQVLDGIDQRLTQQIAAAREIAIGDQTAADDTADTDTDTDAAAPAPTTRDALAAIVAQVVPDRNESSLGVLSGQALFAPGVQTSFDMPFDPTFIDRILGEVADGSVRLGSIATNGLELRYIAAPVAIDDERGVFIIGTDVRAELADFTAAFAAYALVALIVLAILGLVAWTVAGRLLAPLRQLRLAAEDITASARSARIPVVGRDDVSQLTRTVNGMLDRLDGALTSQRRLLDDVRHELKTPITIVRGHLELMDPVDVGDVRSTQLIAIDELDRMSGLIDEIEILAESRLLQVRPKNILAGELTSEVFAKARGFRAHQWRLSGSAAGVVSVDRQKMAQAWLQLVDNAVKYSPAGSTISIGSADRGETVEFWVQDAGPGIPAGSEHLIFERAGRADTSGAPGSGLGLSIVRSIVAAHGGRVALASSAGGTRIGFILPAQPSPVRPLTPTVPAVDADADVVAV